MPSEADYKTCVTHAQLDPMIGPSDDNLGRCILAALRVLDYDLYKELFDATRDHAELSSAMYGAKLEFVRVANEESEARHAS